MNENLFIKNKQGKLLEGPLSDKPTKILFVMKEPNGEKLNCFWMKDNVLSRKDGSKYYNVLGAFAKSIIGESHHLSLEQCAYINLYPDSGTSNVAGGEYKKLIALCKGKPIKETQNTKASLNQILDDRFRIIKYALENGISVVAHFEIANVLAKYSPLTDYLEETTDYEKNKYHITSYQYKNKAKLYAMPHPAYSIKYDTLSKILKLKSSVYPEELTDKMIRSEIK